MKILFQLSLITATVLTCQLSFAQQTPKTPVTRPADATGLCKDGTYSTDALKSGACRGHKGVKEWYSTATASPSATSTGTSGTASTPSTATPSAAPEPTPPAQATTPSPTTQVRTQSQAAAQAAAQSDTPPPTGSIKSSDVTQTAAPGGGPGMVWLNEGSQVYHCPGTKYYGKTKKGSYMTEAEAKTKGAHGAHGVSCTK